ncbi:MAG: hypothetical protein OJF61_001168 [Rhodanobacteraceae bacterium]|jgi:hypothetical protein|nr:MAG: hypothetical protein OJF61_001168 [Rhodanobacteraceae bacterium]
MNAWLPRTLAQWFALPIGIAALVACALLGLWDDPKQTMLSWLYAFFFFTGLSVGSLALLMTHSLTGGAWGWCIRAPLLAAARLLPLMAVAVIPLLVEMRVLYPWTAPAPNAQAPAQSWYLADTFFIVRTVVYFAVWIGWLTAFTRNMHDRVIARRIAAPGLILFGITSYLAATDWAISLTPHWHSSVFGMMVGAGWMLVACAFATAIVAWTRVENELATPDVLHDLGNLMLMFVLAWAYLAFMQYLTIWIADLPDENAWYIPRTLTSWRYLAWFLIACLFVLPFLALLSRAAKRRRIWLRTIASMLVIANFADAFWLIVPGLRPFGFTLHWTDLCAPLGLGALWWCGYLGQLRHARRELVIPSDAVAGMERSHG